jgi:hypothetical protein
MNSGVLNQTATPGFQIAPSNHTSPPAITNLFQTLQPSVNELSATTTPISTTGSLNSTNMFAMNPSMQVTHSGPQSFHVAATASRPHSQAMQPLRSSPYESAHTMSLPHASNVATSSASPYATTVVMQPALYSEMPIVPVQDSSFTISNLTNCLSAFRDVCLICYAKTGQELKHGQYHCTELQNTCLRCLDKGHSWNTCKFQTLPKGPSGICWKCGFPWRSLGLNGTHMERDLSGKVRCVVQASANMVVFGLYLYKHPNPTVKLSIGRILNATELQLSNDWNFTEFLMQWNGTLSNAGRLFITWLEMPGFKEFVASSY